MLKFLMILAFFVLGLQSEATAMQATGPVEKDSAYSVRYYCDYSRCYYNDTDQWQGSVQVTAENLSVTVSPTYLDIEDQILLTTATNGSYGNPNDSVSSKLQISGTFTLPNGAVIEGALVWNGTQILQAKVRPSGKNVYDTTKADTVQYPSAAGALIISQISGNNYQLTLNSVSFGEAKQIRIRYLLFNSFTANGFETPLVPISSSFGVTLPAQFQVSLKGAAGIQSVKLKQNGSAFIKNLPSTLFCNNDGTNYYLSSAQFSSPLIGNTSFSSGSWAGDYMMFWGGVPESLQVYAGLREEVVFLWKWIESGSFVQWSNNSKTISDYGTMAISQAGSIRQAANDIVQGPAKVGMLLDKGDSNYSNFPLCGKGSKGLDTLLGFLDGFDQQYILNTIAGDEFSTPGGKIDLVALRKKYAHEFSVSMQKVYSMYSPSQKVIKHLIVITVGPRLTSETPRDTFIHTVLCYCA